MVALDEETFRTPPFEGSPSVTWTPEIGRVLTAIIDGGAKVVGFDIVFPTSIEQSAVPFGDETLGARLRGFDRDYLRALALGARAGKVVLGEVQHQDKPVLPSPGQRAAVGFGRNIRALNVYSDPDGVIRRVPLVFTVDGERGRLDGGGARRARNRCAAARAARRRGRRGRTPSRSTSRAAPTTSRPSRSPTCAPAPQKDDKDFFRRHFDGKVVLIGTLLDVEDRKITSKRFATAPEGARAERCALAAAGRTGQTFTRDLISGVYVQATAVNNLIRGDPLTEFGRIGTGIASFALAALAVAAALALGPTGAALASWHRGALDARARRLRFATRWRCRWSSRCYAHSPRSAPRSAIALSSPTALWRRSSRASAPARPRWRVPPPSSAPCCRACSRATSRKASSTSSPHMIPAREVGGDLYDIVKLDQNRVADHDRRRLRQRRSGLAVHGDHADGDAAGGARSARIYRPRSARPTISSSPTTARSMFTTLFCGVIDVPSGTMTYCNCGHNPPLVLRRGERTFEPLRACGPPLGIMDGMTYKPRKIALAPGDMLLLYTDGVTEAENWETAQFGMERLEAAVLATLGEPARRVVEEVIARVMAFADGAPQSDDITCLAVVRGGVAAGARGVTQVEPA